MLLLCALYAPSIRTIDLSAETSRQTIVDREPGQYLGHVSTTLLPDGHTILCVYPKGHGKGAIVHKRSVDGGKTWSERLPTPANWASSQEVPTLFQCLDARGKRRIVLFSGLYPIRTALSEDLGATWSELRPVGDWGGIVAMASMVKHRQPGHYTAFFHDDGRFFEAKPILRHPVEFTLYATTTVDGGAHWGAPRPIWKGSGVNLCEPGVVRSPDGKKITLMLRENARRKRSMAMTSVDEGVIWSEPKEMAWTLTGDRHVAQYLPDGRLLVTFRDMSDQSPWKGDWVAWVGRYADLESGRLGQLRIRLMDNQDSWDCAYSGLELLPDGTSVLTTYGHWEKGAEPYIVSVRLSPNDLR